MQFISSDKNHHSKSYGDNKKICNQLARVQKVLNSFLARLHLVTRYVVQGCEDRLSLYSPAIEILTTTCKPLIDRGVWEESTSASESLRLKIKI